MGQSKFGNISFFVRLWNFECEINICRELNLNLNVYSRQLQDFTIQTWVFAVTVVSFVFHHVYFSYRVTTDVKVSAKKKHTNRNSSGKSVILKSVIYYHTAKKRHENSEILSVLFCVYLLDLFIGNHTSLRQTRNEF